MRSLLVAASLVLTAPAAVLAGGAPWPAAPGQCVGQVALPGRAESQPMSVLVAPGGASRRHVPAVVERRWRLVLVRPGRVERVRTAAVWRTVSTSHVVAGPRRWVRTADRYDTRTEQVVVAPGHWVWRRRFGRVMSGPPQPGQTVVQPTGEILCRIWCPARTESVEKTVLIAPGRAYAVPTTVRRWVSHRVLVRPAGFVTRRIAPQYRQVAETRLVRPGHVETVRYAPRYGVVEQRRMVGGGFGWAPVVCGGPLSRPAMARLQASLAAKGYDPGPSDGWGRTETYAALRRFQMDHGMAAGQVTVESARALGVIR